MEKNCAVLIMSCDKYADLWDPFFQQFWKCWSNCPYKVYLGSNLTSPSSSTKAVSILSGKDTDWSSSYMRILDQIPEENLFVWIEDAILSSKVDTDQIKAAFEFLSKPDTNLIHAKPIPKQDKIVDEIFGKYDRKAPYRVTVIGFWKKSALKRILIPGETAWNFEIMGSYRAAYEDGYYCLLKQPFEYIHMIEKGQWIRSGLAYCIHNDIQIDAERRPTSRFHLAGTMRQFYFFNVILRIPWQVRVKIMDLLRKLIASY